MKRIGILGGSSDQATADYYRRLNSLVNERLGGWNTADLLISSMNFALAARWNKEQEWDSAAKYLHERSLALQSAGAELLLCVSNTLHRVANVFTQGLHIPFLHIVDPTGAAIRARALKRVGLLGTKAAMSADFLSQRYRENFGVEILVPSLREQDVIDHVIFDELCRGVLTDAAKQALLSSIDGLKDRGAQGAILGCTEIPLVIGQADRPHFPLFDTTGLHVAAAIEIALEHPVGITPRG